MSAHLFGAIWGSGVLPIGLALLVAWCLPVLRRREPIPEPPVDPADGLYHDEAFEDAFPERKL